MVNAGLKYSQRIKLRQLGYMLGGFFMGVIVCLLLQDRTVSHAPYAVAVAEVTRATARQREAFFGPCLQFVPEFFPTIKDIVVDPDDPDALKANELQGHGGEDWSPCTHLKKYGFNFPVFLARLLTFHVQPKTALEFGCGLGTMSDFLARFTPGGAVATCIEPSAMMSELFQRRPWPQRPEQLALNIFDAHNDDVAQCKSHLETTKFDLVLTFEVLEHIKLEYHPIVLDFLAASTGKYLFFSAAHTGQNGHGHISNRDKADYAEELKKRGLVHMPNLEFMAKHAARSKRSYDITANLLVFRNPNFEVDDLVYLNVDTWFAGYKGDQPWAFGADHNRYFKAVNMALWPELEWFVDKNKSPCKNVQ